MILFSLLLLPTLPPAVHNSHYIIHIISFKLFSRQKCYSMNLLKKVRYNYIQVDIHVADICLLLAYIFNNDKIFLFYPNITMWSWYNSNYFVLFYFLGRKYKQKVRLDALRWILMQMILWHIWHEHSVFTEVQRSCGHFTDGLSELWSDWIIKCRRGLQTVFIWLLRIFTSWCSRSTGHVCFWTLRNMNSSVNQWKIRLRAASNLLHLLWLSFSKLCYFRCKMFNMIMSLDDMHWI